jgi:uncharacterized protein (TIGR02569 family)
MPIRPPRAVIEAFDAAGAPVPLAGGRGNAWRVGELVLRPVADGEPPLDWQRDVLGSIACDEFRVSLPRRTLGGDFASEGWCGWQFVQGMHDERRWPEIITVGELFHLALADLPEPEFVARRTDHWAVGDRVAWEEVPTEQFMHVKHLPDLLAARRPLEAPHQLVHGDLTGNVLFAEGLTPAIIDFSPFWRPPAYASAIVVADAFVWEGADESLLDAVAHIPHFPQFLVRALIMRAVVDRLFREDESIRGDDDDPFSRAVEIACRLATS